MTDSRPRASRQRDAVIAALREQAEFVSAQELHARIRSQGPAPGLTTVYRHLTALADSGAVDVLCKPDGESVYRACASGEHHHHLVCRSCGTSVELSAEAVEPWVSAMAEEHGFTAVDHVIELFGLCPTCS